MAPGPVRGALLGNAGSTSVGRGVALGATSRGFESHLPDQRSGTGRAPRIAAAVLRPVAQISDTSDGSLRSNAKEEKHAPCALPVVGDRVARSGWLPGSALEASPAPRQGLVEGHPREPTDSGLSDDRGPRARRRVPRRPADRRAGRSLRGRGLPAPRQPPRAAAGARLPILLPRRLLARLRLRPGPGAARAGTPRRFCRPEPSTQRRPPCTRSTTRATRSSAS